MAKIDINNKLENKIVFSWNEDNNCKEEITLYIDQEKGQEKEENKNPFDKLFDFIINKLEKGEEIELPDINKFKENDNKINSIILAILEPLKNEINEIKNKISKISTSK